MLRIIRNSGVTSSALALLALLAAPHAHADVATLPPHEKTFSSDFGSFTVGTRDDTINRIAPLDTVGTTREALLTTTAYGKLNGEAGGVLQTGYAVGCAAKLDQGVLGTNPQLEVGVEGPQQNYGSAQSQRYAQEQTHSNGSQQSQSHTSEQSGSGPSVEIQTEESGQDQRQQSGQVQEHQQSQLQDQQGVKPHITVNPSPKLDVTLKPGEVKEFYVLVGAGKPLVANQEVRVISRDFHIQVANCVGPVTIRQFTYVYANTQLVDDSGAVFGDPVTL